MARTPKATALDLSKNHRLTVDSIDRLCCPDGKQQAFMRCAEVNGLQVRVTANGFKSFVFQRKANGQSMRVTIGAVSAWSIADAQKEARRLAVTLDKGDDPRQIARDKQAAKAAARAEQDRANNFTFANLMIAYANELERQGKTSHAKVRAMMRLHLVKGCPELASTPANKVTAEQVADLLRSLSEAGKSRTAGKVRSYTRAAFEMARTAKLDHEVPVHFKAFEVKHNPAAETVAIKLQTDKNPLKPIHLRQYWQVIEKLPGVQGAALRLHLLTGGQRIEQLRLLVRSNVKPGAITLLDAKGRVGRGARPHTVPLNAAARAAMAELLALNAAGDFPISVTSGKTAISAKAFAEWAKAAASGIEWQDFAEPVGQFQAKRLRSGVETALASLRVSQEIRGHLLSHGVKGVQASSYDGHDYEMEKLEALNALHRYLTESSANVVHISAREAA
jgi:integrase